MWKVLIADDEPKIRHGLEKTLSCLGLDLEVCAQAKNGMQALTLAEEMRPDLILADICMPRLNGLDFLRELKKLELQCRVLIISGFNEFSYAKEAIELGVSGYLLKPISEEELRAGLTRAIAELEEEKRSGRLLDLLRRQIGKYRGQLLEVLFAGWLEGSLDSAELEEQQVMLGVRLEEKYTILMVSMQDVILQTEDDVPVTQELYQGMVREVLGDELKQYTPVCIFTNRYQDQVAIIKGDIGEADRLQTHIRGRMGEAFGGRCFVQMCSGTGEAAAASYQDMCGSARRALECRPIVQQARQYINTHFMDHSLCLTVVADAIGCNASYLSRIMKQELGMTFTDYLTSVRISQAIQMMRITGMSLQQIADQTGYGNQHYFSVAFKNAQGVSPSEYRRYMKDL